MVFGVHFLKLGFSSHFAPRENLVYLVICEKKIIINYWNFQIV